MYSTECDGIYWAVFEGRGCKLLRRELCGSLELKGVVSLLFPPFSIIFSITNSSSQNIRSSVLLSSGFFPRLLPETPVASVLVHNVESCSNQ